MKLLEKAKEAAKTMDYQEAKDENGQVTRAWYSFKLEAISNHNPFYNVLSPIVREGNCDEDTNYKFTSQAIDAIIEILETDPNADLEDYENITNFAEAPIYNSELLDWFAKGNQNAVDDAVQEFGWNEGIMQVLQTAYSRAWENNYFRVLEALKEM